MNKEGRKGGGRAGFISFYNYLPSLKTPPVPADPSEERPHRRSAQPPASSRPAPLPQPPLRPQPGEGSGSLHDKVTQKYPLYDFLFELITASCSPLETSLRQEKKSGLLAADWW